MGVKKTFLLVILNVFTRIMMCPSSTLTYTMLSAAISPFKLSSYKKQISRIYRYFLLDFEKKIVFLNSEHPYCLNPVIMLGKKKLGPVGSAVFTFIGYKQTSKDYNL